MELFLVRHGPAEDRNPRRWPEDEDRPLSTPGIRQTRVAAEGFARIVGSLDRMFTSPAVRAARTAEIFSRAFDDAPRLEELDELRPGAPSATALARLKTMARGRVRWAVVGHEPALGELLGLALVGEAMSVTRLAKAGAAEIEFPKALVPGGGRVRWVLTRKQLSGLGRRA